MSRNITLRTCQSRFDKAKKKVDRKTVQKQLNKTFNKKEATK
jgi:hypothetical protein